MTLNTQDNKLQSSSFEFSLITPTSSSATSVSNETVTEDDWGKSSAVPCEGKKYIIREYNNNNNQVIAQGQDRSVCLQQLSTTSDNSVHWLCIEHQGYFTFKNLKSGRYLGHDGGDRIIADALLMNDWELFIPKQLPRGGYHLLSPYYWNALWAVTIDEGVLCRRVVDSDSSAWDFIEV